MKLKFLLAMSVGLSLAGCSPALTPAIKQTAPVPQSLSAPKAQARTESLRVRLPEFVAGFKTKMAYYSDLSAIRFRVSGEGLSTSESADTEVEVDVDIAANNGTQFEGQGSGEATIRDIPAEDGAWRIVTAVGLDSEGNEMAAFTAKSYYQSDEGGSTSVSFSRAGLVLARGIEFLIENDNTSLLDELGEDDWIGIAEEASDALGYSPDNNRFVDTDDDVTDPLEIDPETVAAAILDGTLLAGSAVLEPVDRVLVEVPIEPDSDSDNLVAEDAVVTINDPYSHPLTIPRFSAFNDLSFPFVVGPGTWRVDAHDANGELIDSINVIIDYEENISFEGNEFGDGDAILNLPGTTPS